MTTNSDEERTTIRDALAMAQQICHERFCDPHPMGQSEACKTMLEAIALLDRSAAGDTSNLLRRLRDFLFENCNHNERDRNYDWCPSCVMAFMEVAARPSNSDAATRMREACVDAIKSLRATPRGAAYGNAINDAIHKVESLTLDQVEQKK